MTSITINLSESLKHRIEALANAEGVSVSQFIASAAGEKVAAIMSLEYLKQQAATGRREDFDRYLAAVPNAPPIPGDELP